MDPPQIRLKEKSVIIHRDENGFGLRVGGQNPVFVDCVHENGAAWKAGVRRNDRIIKVNGTLVRSYDHQRVVQMIQNCTPFVNLTLHSPEPADCHAAIVAHSYTLGVDQSNGNVIAVGGECSMLVSGSGAGNNSQNNQTNNLQIHPHNHHFNHPQSSSNLHINSRRHVHPHSLQGNLNWLHDIGDDLFQDNQQKQAIQQHQQQQEQLIPIEQLVASSGVSKLIVSGPNPLNHSTSNAFSLSSSSSRPNRSQSNNSTRDNPYYYYKTAQQQQHFQQTHDNTLNDAANCKCNASNPTITTSASTTSLLCANDNQQVAPPKTGSSMVRSRSSSKMSTRSTTSKYAKARKIRSRLVEDLRSLAITNSQTTPSSLSTSPSSSDLSDCDSCSDQPNGRLDCGPNLNSTNLSQSPNSGNTIMIASLNQSQSQHQSQEPGVLNIKNNNNKSVRITTRRLEIIRELVDTEKTHTEKLKQLNDLLYKPIKQENLIPPDQLKLVFSCHKSLFKIHRQIYKKLLAAQVNYSEQPEHYRRYLQEPLVGKALIEIFEGELGKRLEQAASSFCACQSTNTDLLNRITRKDTKSGEFLAQVANQQMLGRLGIKDLLACCFQRLTKYPLLLDNLLKATPNLVATASAAATGVTGSGMIHSKSLSEGCIAIPLNAATAMTAASNINHTIDESTNQDYNQSMNEPLTICNNPNTQFAQMFNNSPSSTTVTTAATTTATTAINHYESIDETEQQENNTTLDSVASSSSNASNNNTTAPIISTSLSDEYAYERLCIERALRSSRQILIHVNEAVNRAVAQSKLKEIWRRTDKNPSLPVIDIDNQQLLHEGLLTLRMNRRQFEVYVLLLTNYLVILTREGQDKYKLKYFTSDGKSIPNTQLSPIFNIDEHLSTRDTATDENGFYLLCKRKDDSRIYEFASQSPLERAKWKEKIHMAKQCNFAVVPDDDNTLTRYTELISLTNSVNTPKNVEHIGRTSSPAPTQTSSTGNTTSSIILPKSTLTPSSQSPTTVTTTTSSSTAQASDCNASTSLVVTLNSVSSGSSHASTTKPAAGTMTEPTQSATNSGPSAADSPKISSPQDVGDGSTMKTSALSTRTHE